MEGLSPSAFQPEPRGGGQLAGSFSALAATEGSHFPLGWNFLQRRQKRVAQTTAGVCRPGVESASGPAGTVSHWSSTLNPATLSLISHGDEHRLSAQGTEIPE